MILGIGFDLVDINRIHKLLNKWGDKFLNKILTESEQGQIPKNRAQYIASRFAAKEAFVKALGTGFSRGISFKHIEITSNMDSPPRIIPHKNALKIIEQLKVKNIYLSISHEKNIAGAMVIIEC